ncbi:MAG: hypothetical protein IJA19_05795 [Clostridia bacterium]|nr:hypothetical protein [Clostridia bacterium]
MEQKKPTLDSQILSAMPRREPKPKKTGSTSGEVRLIGDNGERPRHVKERF